MADVRPPSPCVDCGITTYGGGVWSRMTAEQRQGARRHEAYGRCNACYVRHRWSAEADPNRDKIPATEVVSEWEFLSHDWTASRSHRIRTAAPRLGMTPGALDKALRRAGVAA